MSLFSSLRQHAHDEGKKSAIRVAQDLQSSLETIAELGNKKEMEHAQALLRIINLVLSKILEDAKS